MKENKGQFVRCTLPRRFLELTLAIQKVVIG